METIRTHEAIDRRLRGEPVELASGRARLVLDTVPEMAVDERGLVHGGFLFGLADHAAMLAVNHPNVVLGRGEMKFLQPVVVGELTTQTRLVTADPGVAAVAAFLVSDAAAFVTGTDVLVDGGAVAGQRASASP